MAAVIACIRAIALGALAISLVVFVHEVGHYLAARACGVRVTELFLGLPCRWSLSRVSKRSGTRFGITPLLLSGYARICGMEELRSPYAAAVLSVVSRSGQISMEALAATLAISTEETAEAGMELAGWGSVCPQYGPGDHRGRTATPPSGFAAMPRDPAGNTPCDGPAFAQGEATGLGGAWEPPRDGRTFLARERTHVFAGKGFWQRALILVAGVAVNIAFGLALLTGGYAVLGVASDQNVIGAVEAGSPAEAAGLQAGDEILAIDDTETSTWSELRAVQQQLEPGQAVTVTYERSGERKTVALNVDDDGYLGIEAVLERPGLLGCAMAAASLLAATAGGFVDLIVPQAATAGGFVDLIVPQAGTAALEDASSLVEIFDTLQMATERGAHFALEVIAALSFSLGFLNLLPVLPLDGGKLVLEMAQAAIGRPVSARAQAALTLIGSLLLLALCILVLVA